MGRIESFADLGCLVTGASSGIGRELARVLAERGARLVVTARRETRLRDLAEELLAAGAPQAHVLVADLADPASVERLADEAREALAGVDVLVNNAGFAVPGRFAHCRADRMRAMIEVNIVAATTLMRRFLPEMLERDRGGVLNVSSMAAFQAAPYTAPYAGTKAFLLNLSESVYQEMKHSNVVVTALCPGMTDTEFFEAAGYRHPAKLSRRRMPARDVAEIALRAFAKGRMTVVPGLGSRSVLFIERLLPRRAVGAIARRVLGGRKLRKVPKDKAS